MRTPSRRLRVLVDVVHPAHVHFYRHMIAALRRRGDEVKVVSRHKDVTVPLLDELGIDHVAISSIGRPTRPAQASELLRRDWRMWRLARRWRPHVVLTRNPAGLHVARLVGAVGIFDTDDGPDVGIHWRLAAPFAHVITTPASLGLDLGPRHRTYDAYKSSAFLHPDHWVPTSPPIREVLGLDPEQPFSIVRLVSMQASHDRGERGLAPATVEAVVATLQERGPVYGSSEADGRPVPGVQPLQVPVSRFHDALAAAALVVGDSQSVITEAAMLGTPTVHASSYSGRASQLVEMERDYGLVRSFDPSDHDEIVHAVRELAHDPEAGARSRRARDRLLARHEDVVSWYLRLIDEVRPAFA